MTLQRAQIGLTEALTFTATLQTKNKTPPVSIDPNTANQPSKHQHSTSQKTVLGLKIFSSEYYNFPSIISRGWLNNTLPFLLSSLCSHFKADAPLAPLEQTRHRCKTGGSDSNPL